VPLRENEEISEKYPEKLAENASQNATFDRFLHPLIVHLVFRMQMHWDKYSQRIV
jgi:hypothetical protein